LGLVPAGKMCTAFPYSLHRDPQYLGCMMQWIGVGLAVGLELEGAMSMRGDVWGAVAWFCGLYFVTMEVEKRELAQ
ncbi:hypothetical protein HDU98_005962, partial [Podochytrium sp. JEL0797]